MKSITFEFGAGAGAMFLEDKEKKSHLIKISPDEYNVLKDLIDMEKYKCGYILMAGDLVHANTYDYKFTKAECQLIIEYIKNNLMKENDD